MKNKELLKAVIGVLLLIVIVSSVTYAAFVWASDPESGIIEGTSECFVLDYTKGTDILNGNLDFGSTYTDGLSTTVKAKLNSECNIENAVGTLYINIDDTTSDYLIDNNIIRYQVLEDNVEVENGTISSKGQIPLYSNIEVTEVEKTYTVYIWINITDTNDSNISNIMSSTFSSAIGMKAESR